MTSIRNECKFNLFNKSLGAFLCTGSVVTPRCVETNQAGGMVLALVTQLRIGIWRQEGGKGIQRRREKE